VKYSPRVIVNKTLKLNRLTFFSFKAWWPHVKVTPEQTRTTVFRRGTENADKEEIPTGGQQAPTPTSGDRLAWKNAQKNERKKKHSDKINRIIPHLILVSTTFVCTPWNALSALMSAHQKKDTEHRERNLSINKLLFIE
jgi:hypothetical protein